MKYWRGYITAAIFVAITWALQEFARTHTVLIDMLYPYVTRLVQTSLAQWSAGLDVCLWQVLAVLLGVAFLASIVVMIIIKWNFFQWLGWVLTCASLLFMLHTGLYGLNTYAGSLADDIRLTQTDYTVTELVEATRYFRDQANELALQIPRDAQGNPDYPDFEVLAEAAGDGYTSLAKEQSYSVFAGSTVPVKKLGWADMYSAMGINGMTMPLTGEAAVNPQIPDVALPFTMCHEMAHRMCIALENDANLAAFLACRSNDDLCFQYSGNFMAYLYCINALDAVGTSTATAAASELRAGINDSFRADLKGYNDHYAKAMDDTASQLASDINNTYITASGDDRGVLAYGDVCQLLVSWHIQEIYLPAHQEDIPQFDPLDKDQVDLSDILEGRK